MEYKKSFTSLEVKINRFDNENELRLFVQNNLSEIDIIQIYTSIERDPRFRDSAFIPVNFFHIMYNLKERITI
jgi:hypothetical protein